MPLAFYPSASEPVTLPVAADPCVEEANTPETLGAYLRSSDPTGLVVPDDASRVVLRPLAPAEVAECQRRAGHRPWLARAILASMEEATAEERAAYTRAERRLGRARIDDNADTIAERLAEYLEAGRALTRARAEFRDALADDELDALTAEDRWTERYHREVLATSFVRMVDEGLAHLGVLELLDGLRPLDVASAFRLELYAHAINISALAPAGKAPSGSGSGTGPTASPTAGAVTIAPVEDFAELADCAEPHPSTPTS